MGGGVYRTGDANEWRGGDNEREPSGGGHNLDCPGVAALVNKS